MNARQRFCLFDGLVYGPPDARDPRMNGETVLLQPVRSLTQIPSAWIPILSLTLTEPEPQAEFEFTFSKDPWAQTLSEAEVDE